MSREGFPTVYTDMSDSGMCIVHVKRGMSRNIGEDVLQGKGQGHSLVKVNGTSIQGILENRANVFFLPKKARKKDIRSS